MPLRRVAAHVWRVFKAPPPEQKPPVTPIGGIAIAAHEILEAREKVPKSKSSKWSWTNLRATATHTAQQPFKVSIKYMKLAFYATTHRIGRLGTWVKSWVAIPRLRPTRPSTSTYPPPGLRKLIDYIDNQLFEVALEQFDKPEFDFDLTIKAGHSLHPRWTVWEFLQATKEEDRNGNWADLRSAIEQRAFEQLKEAQTAGNTARAWRLAAGAAAAPLIFAGISKGEVSHPFLSTPPQAHAQSTRQIEEATRDLARALLSRPPNIKAFRRALLAGADPNGRVKRMQPPLHKALEKAATNPRNAVYKEMVKLLVLAGADPEMVREGKTATARAKSYGIDRLLKQAVKQRRLNEELVNATVHGNIQAVREAVKKGADVGVMSYGRPLIQYAAEDWSANIVSALNPNQKIEGTPILHVMVKKENWAAVRGLLAGGADPTFVEGFAAENNLQASLLHEARKELSRAQISYLLYSALQEGNLGQAADLSLSDGFNPNPRIGTKRLIEQMQEERNFDAASWIADKLGVLRSA